MDKLVVFMTSIPFMEHHIQDMYVKEISQKFKVQLWDLSIIYGNADMTSRINNVRIINSVDEFVKILRDTCGNNNVVIVSNILNSSLALVIKYIKLYHIPTININKDSFAASLLERGSLHYIKYFDLKTKISTIIEHTPFLRLYLNHRRSGGIKYEYIMGGVNYYPSYGNFFFKTHQIKYDEYLRARNSYNVVDSDYLIYIGSAPSSHPSYANKKKSLDHTYYTRKLVKYLDLIEIETGLKVIVSAHPKGEYNQADFKNHTIYHGNTANLIHHSKGVICHFSTSLVNAILEYKPIQIIYNGELLRSSFGTTLVMGLELGRICNADLCNMDNPHKWDMKVNRKAYHNFLVNEIINSSYEDKSNAELICEYINIIFNKKNNL